MPFPCSSLLNYPLLERKLEAAIVTVTASDTTDSLHFWNDFVFLLDYKT